MGISIISFSVVYSQADSNDECKKCPNQSNYERSDFRLRITPENQDQESVYSDRLPCISKISRPFAYMITIVLRKKNNQIIHRLKLVVSREEGRTIGLLQDHLAA